MMIIYIFQYEGTLLMTATDIFQLLKEKSDTRTVCLPHQQYINLILQSSNTGKFNVEKLNTEGIIDFKKWTQINFKGKPLSVSSYGKGVPKNEKVTFQVSSYYEFVLTQENLEK